MNFVADENVPRQIIERLRGEGHAVAAVADVAPRAVDDWVLAQADRLSAVLLTIDKDFGELIFRLGRGLSGVALLRLEGLSTAAKCDLVSAAVARWGSEMPGNFAVIAPGRVRIRRA